MASLWQLVHFLIKIDILFKFFNYNYFFRWNTEHCRSEYDPVLCDSNRTVADYFNVKVLTTDHLNEYRKQFFIGPKINYTICTADDLSVQSPVKEFWE